MQQICLQACFKLGIDQETAPLKELNVPQDTARLILEQASTTTNFSSLLDGLHSGPKQRGTTRNQFEMIDGSKGDVYRCILLSLLQDPPQLSFTYDDIYQRTRAVCCKDAPAGSSVAQALSQFPEICETIQPGIPVVDWGEDVLDVVDPYFLFYVRWSNRVASLAK